MVTTIAQIEKHYGLKITPDTPVNVEEQGHTLVLKISLPPLVKEPQKEYAVDSLRDTFETIRTLGQDEEYLDTDNWAEEFKQSKIIQE